MPDIRISSIPEPGSDAASLRDAVLALKANVELLTGQTGPKVLGSAAVSNTALQAALAQLRADLTDTGAYLEITENLADLDDVSVARTNLGLGASATLDKIRVLHVQDEKSSGTQPGTFTSGAWRTRDLNTVSVNEITGASLATNKVTLPAGNYFAHFAAPAYVVSRHQTKLYNVTDAADLAFGGMAYSASPSSGTEPTDSSGSGYFTLAGTKDIELRHRCETTFATVGFGFAVAFGSTEVYGRLTIWKLP